ncbi:hypothetical protein [Sulfurimonas sp.]
MNKKSRLCLFTCTGLLFLLSVEIVYLYLNDTITKKELSDKKKFIAITTLSNLNLALKENIIKTLP